MYLQNYMQIYFPSLRKSAVVFLMLTIIIPGSFMALPQKAEAIPVVVTFSWQIALGYVEWLLQTIEQIKITAKTTITAVKTTYLALKEATLDPIAKLLGKQLADMLVSQMFSFVATGNKGAPAFVTNPRNFLEGVAEESTQVFLTDLQNNRPNMLPSIRNAVRQRIIEENYVDLIKKTQSTFPGNDAQYRAYVKNPSDQTCPTGDSRDCSMALNREENDLFQVYQEESRTLAHKRSMDIKLQQDEILAGSGFHTLKDCIEKDINQNCTEYLNKTPGDTIAKQINEYLTSSLRNLEGADELEEVFEAVAGVKNFLNSKGLANL